MARGDPRERGEDGELEEGQRAVVPPLGQLSQDELLEPARGADAGDRHERERRERGAGVMSRPNARTRSGAGCIVRPARPRAQAPAKVRRPRGSTGSYDIRHHPREPSVGGRRSSGLHTRMFPLFRLQLSVATSGTKPSRGHTSARMRRTAPGVARRRAPTPLAAASRRLSSPRSRPSPPRPSSLSREAARAPPRDRLYLHPEDGTGWRVRASCVCARGDRGRALTRAGPAGRAGPAPRVFAAHAASTPACVARARSALPGARAPARWLVDARGSSPRSSAVSRASPSRGGGNGGGGGGTPRAPSRSSRARCSSRARAVSTTASSTSTSTQYVPGANHADLSKNFEHADVEERLYSWWEPAGSSRPTPTRRASRSRSPCRPPTSPAPSTWATRCSSPSRTSWPATRGCAAVRRSGSGRPRRHRDAARRGEALEAEGKTRVEIGREAFEERTWAWKEEYGGRIAGQIRRLGASCDWSRERFTLDEGLSDAVLEAFVSLHERGLI